MPSPKDDNLQKHTLNLRKGDYQKMGELFPKLGAGPAIRTLISRFVDKHFEETPDKPNEEV